MRAAFYAKADIFLGEAAQVAGVFTLEAGNNGATSPQEGRESSLLTTYWSESTLSS